MSSSNLGGMLYVRVGKDALLWAQDSTGRANHARVCLRTHRDGWTGRHMKEKGKPKSVPAFALMPPVFLRSLVLGL